MAFKLEQNPLDSNPLFAGTQQGSTAKSKNAEKPQKKAAADKPKTEPVKAEKKKPAAAAVQTAKTAKTAKTAEPAEYQRATFIVRRDLLDMLKDYAYTERREIKDVVNELLEKGLGEITAKYEKDGRSFLPHR